MKLIAALLLVGCILVITGVYLLAGLGWCVLAAGVPFIASAWVLIRGDNATPEN